MLYFFHVSIGGLRVDDTEGQDFSTYAEAYADAIESGRAVIVDVIHRGGFLSHADNIEIADAEGGVRVRLPLEQLLKPPTERQLRPEPPLSSAVDLVGAVRSVAGDLLSECLSATEAQRGNVQLLDRQTGHLTIHAQHGFGSEFLTYFARVDIDGESACSHALRAQKPHVVRDVSDDPSMVTCANVLSRAGVKAVQSTPLLSSNGILVGIVSTHFDKPAQPTEVQMQAVSTAARKAADTILRLRAEMEV